MIKRMLFLSLLLALARPALAANPYSRSFELSVSGISVGQLILNFEDVIEVGDFSVELSASSGSPSGSVLPGLVVPYSLPLLNSPLFITINTNTSFRGPVEIVLRLYLLEYNPTIPLRLFAAAGTIGSIYRDITAYAGSGSMYTRGYRNGFSEFVIALDGRLLSNVIENKFAELTEALNSKASIMPLDRAEELRGYLQQAREAWNRGEVDDSIESLEEDFIESVREGASNGEIPNSFNDPTNPHGNVAGDLLARAKTTLFSLKLAR